MKLSLTFLIFILVFTKDSNAQRFEMKASMDAKQKFEIHGIILDLVENDTLEFIDEFSKEKPDIRIPLCREWGGYLVVPIGDFIEKLYIVSWVKGMQNFIDYLGGEFREMKIYETKLFEVSIMSHSSSNNDSYITFDKKYKDSVVIFAKKFLGDSLKYSHNFLMIREDSTGTLYRRNSDPVYDVAPFYNCKPILEYTPFFKDYQFDAMNILSYAEAEDLGFYFNLKNDDLRVSHVTRLIKYGKWDIAYGNNEIIITGKDLESVEDCISKVKFSTCKYFYVDYQLIYEWECIFRLVIIKPTTLKIYPCTIEIGSKDLHGKKAKVEILVPFDYTKRSMSKLH